MPTPVIDLLFGPFRGTGIYPRAASSSTLRVLAALAVVALLGAGLLGASHYARLTTRIDSLQESPLWLMPRVRIVDGLARVDGEPGRVVTDERFVVVFDTSESPQVEPAPVGDERPRYLVSRAGLVVYTVDRPFGSVLPWSTLNRVAGDLTIDGPELVDSLRRARWKISGVVAGAYGAGCFFGLLIWTALLVWLYRIVSFKSLHLPDFGPLFRAGVCASFPALALASALNLLPSVADSVVVTVLLAASAVGFLIGAARVRLGGGPSGTVPPELGEPPPLQSASEASEAPGAVSPEAP